MKTAAWGVVVAVGALLPLGAASAEVIVQYTFPTLQASETGPGYNPTTVHAGLDAAFDMAVKDGGANITIEISNPSPNYGSQPVLRVNPASGNTGITAAIANNAYFQFTIAPDSGMVLNLTDLTFNAARGGGSTPRGWAMTTSVGGLTTVIASSDIGTQRPDWTPYTVDLSGPAFQDLSGPLTIRFYAYSPASGSTIEFDDITLNGAVVPEPHGAALLLIGMVGFLFLRRTRRRDRSD
jgi:hypothetical protein